MDRIKPGRVVVVASCNIDLITFAERFPKPGETIFGTRFDMGFGGKGANQAVAAAKLGAQVHAIARLGEDIFGRETIRNFQEHRVGVEHVKTVSGVSSGVAPIFVDPKGQNHIWVVKGANDALAPADIDAARDLIASAALLLLQLEVPIPTVEHAIALAHQAGVPVVLNPAPAALLSPAALARVTILVPNESEAEALSDIPVRDLAGAQRAASQLRQSGVQTVIITLGEHGALVCAHNGEEYIPGIGGQAVDTTGAGDAFIGGLAAFLVDGKPLREAARLANRYAGLSTRRVGTQKSFLTRAELAGM